MTKSPKNRRTRRPRSRSTQVNVGTQRTPINPVQNAGRVVANAVSTGAQRTLDSGSKVMRRSKNRDSDATVQQGDASAMIQQDITSMTVNTPSSSTPDGGNSGTNAAQEHSVMDPEASFQSELGSRAPQFGTSTTNEFSPIRNQVTSPTRSVDPSKINLGTPPRLDPSGNNSVTVTGMDLLDVQGATASSNSVVGTHIPAPSPR